MEQVQVKAACDAAVDAIAALDETKWTQWATYMLEQLDGASRLNLVLGNVAHDLTRRLETGEW